MTKENLSSVFLVLAFAGLLAIIAWRKEIAVTVEAVANNASGNTGGLQNLATMAPVARLNYNWAPPPFMAAFMPQVTKADASLGNPASGSTGYSCGACNG